MTGPKRWAVACMAGSFKGVFVHGVLHGLEAGGFRADAYGAASSSTLAAAFAAAGHVRQVDLGTWTRGEDIVRQSGAGMSDAVLAGIRDCAPRLRELLFAPNAARFCIVASHVRTPEAAALTQGDGARRLGRRLLIEAARHDATWRDRHLEAHLFDTRATDGARRITPDNFEEVAYATTRMLHAWHIPAAIAGEPYIDASYTCQCPAVEMAGSGYDAVLAIGTEVGPLQHDIFGTGVLPSEYRSVPIVQICPKRDLKELGVDFNHATPDGLAQAFAEGVAAAGAFLIQHALARHQPVA
jgi:hypothetical protein